MARLVRIGRRTGSGGDVAGADRSLAPYGRADQVAALIFEVVHAAMEQEAIVPDDQCVLPPLDPAMIMEALGEALEIVEQRPALLLAPADEALEIGGRRVEGLAAGARMHPDRGMDAFHFILGKTVMFAQAQPLFGRKLGVVRPDMLARIRSEERRVGKE